MSAADVSSALPGGSMASRRPAHSPPASWLKKDAFEGRKIFIARRTIWPTPGDIYRSMYGEYSDGTSITSSDATLHSSTSSDSVDEDGPGPSYEPSDVVVQSDRVFSAYDREIFQNNNNPAYDIKISKGLGSHRYRGYDSDESRHPERFPSTVLSEFLEDCDKIAEYKPARSVESVQYRSSDEGSLPAEYGLLPVKPSSERWLVLLIICLSVGVRSFVSVVFGQINDIFSTYFDVGPEAVDWLTNTGSLSTLFAIIALVLCGGRRLKLRSLCLFMTGTASIGTTMLTAAMTDRFYGYALGIAGQIAMGLNNAVAMSISPLIAATWFPNGQVATALSATLIFVGLGEALGSYLPGVVVFTTTIFNAESNGSGEDEENLLMADIEESVRFKLVTLFVIPTGLSVCTFVIAFVFLKERPQLPPSEAQARIRGHVHNSETDQNKLVSISRSSIEAATTWSGGPSTMQYFKKKSFLLITFIYGVVAASGSLSITLLSSMLRYVDDQEASLDSDAVSGRIMTVMWICFIAGPLVTGFVLDKTGKYKEMAVTTTLGLMLGSAGIPLSVYHASTLGLFISHGFVGFFMGASETTLFEIAAETTYPAPELTFASLLNISWVTFFVLFPVTGRAILNMLEDSPVIAATGASLVPALFTAVAAALAAFCLRPTYNRRAGNIIDSGEESNENTPLLGTL